MYHNAKFRRTTIIVLLFTGDANLGRDKFLHEQLKLDEGWVPLDVLITFNRLAKLSKDVEEIGNALHKSTTGLLEVSHYVSQVP